MKILKALLVVFIFYLAGFFLIKYFPNNSKPENIKEIKIAGQVVKVDLALTDAEQTRGLSGRKDLAKNEGMLFVFSKPDKYIFWMKDMNFPIDIIWLSGDMRVVYIKKDALPELYPETYGPHVDAKYVLEVPDNFSNQNNLKIGDTAIFTY